MSRTRVLLGVILLAAGIFLAMFALFARWIHAPLPIEGPVQIKIESGMSGRQIGHLLKERGVINSVESFRWAIWLQGAEQDLRLGTVQLSPPLTRYELIEILRHKSPFMGRIIIREGWPSWRIFAELSQQFELSEEYLRRLQQDTNFIASLGLEVNDLEGFLFPETYYISLDASEEDVLRQMVNMFKKIGSDFDFENRAQEVGLDLKQAVTLASIIEREARVAQERTKISAVFHNRLARGMRLQADPTVLFAMQNYAHTLSRNDLKIVSPYNTYRNTGLPPGPICNPGRKSLEAAVMPADIESLFFVARGDGSHAFSRTYREHREAIQKYRR